MSTNKAFSTVAIVIAILFNACAPGNTSNSTEKDEKIYAEAIRSEDLGTALMAAYNILYASDSNYTFYDTIAQLYSDLGNPQGAYNMAEAGLKMHKSMLLDKVMAQANKDLGNYTEAIDQFKALLEADPENKLNYQYSIGEAYFMMEDLKNCVEYMDMVVTNEQSGTATKVLQTQKGGQRVPYRLAAMNIIAYVMMIEGKYDMAEKVLTDVLTQKEDFELAYNNYKLLQQLKSRKQ